jgi:MoxR-like ATPase
MNFVDALLSIELVLESGGVPLLVGDSGIGKTSLVNKLCKEKDYHGIVIDGNMLKEGEIGGLPSVEDYEVVIGGKKIKRKRTVYAVHSKLQEIEAVLLENEEKNILIFVDEINRCEHTVQQELMNIVLNREINGYVLPKNALVIAAMNPSNKYDNFQDSQYMVVDMDPAQENRFVWIEMESDVNSWLAWGLENNIDEAVLEFISSFPQYLHTPKSSDNIKATPRSWERISNTYKVYKNKSETLPERIFYNVAKGNVGASIAQEFCMFLENNKKPLLKASNIFLHGLTEEISKEIKSESHSRLYLLARNLLSYMDKLQDVNKETDIFCQLLELYPPDLKLGIMKELREDYKDSLYKGFIMNDKFVEGYFALHKEN